jgi:hypothetical protein
MGLNPAIRSEKPRLTPDEGHIIFICWQYLDIMGMNLQFLLFL